MASSSALSKVEDLKSQGNDAFRKGDVQNAIQQYTSALSSLEKVHGQNDERYSLAATLYSNRAMCHLKLAESNTQQTSSKEINTSLTNCIEDCTTAVEKLEGLENTNNLLGKILYRRARALAAKATNPDNVGDDVVEKALNESAKDLLKLLSFDSKNKEAATLLRIVKAQHAKLGGGRGRTRISRSLDYIQKVINGDLDKNVTTIKNMDGEEKELDPLSCLRILQGSVAEDTSSSSEDIGRRNGVPLLLQIARQGLVSKQLDSQQKEQCRVAALHILSACCSHDPFLLKYGGRSHLPPAVLAQIVEEEAALSNDEFGGDGSADVAVAAMALLVRVIVHWDHREVARYFAPKINKDGTVDDANVASLGEHVPEVDGSSICRVAAAAFLWGSQSNNSNEEADTRPPRAALDLISAWTASDLEALDAASDACFAAPASDSGGDSKQSATRGKRASSHKLTPEDIRRMKPRQVASHRKRESEFTRASLERAIAHIGAFCSNQTGGLDAMLTCAAKTKDVRLRREVGLQIGRMMSVYNEDDDIKKLVSTALGCTDWTVGKEDENGNVVEMSSLTIEELDEEKEMDEEAEKSEEARLLAMMKCGQLTSSMLLGKPAVGTWALKYGWSDGNGVDELKALISSANSRAMSIASELVSAASSVESSRPLLATLVAEGTLQDLLIHPDADVRSGAASCAAKIGLASKALSADEDGVMGLLDIAIELLFDKNEHLDTESTTKALSKVPKSKAATEETTSMDRGIEVMAYLASKTFVKERICNGYVPKGSPKNRKTVLERLVELALTPSNGSQTQMAYGLAGIFNLLAVSIETLRKEAFVGKEITREQYDQLQSLGKTEEEKEAEAKTNEREGDTPTAVGERIRKLAKANVPRAMVKLLEGSGSSSDAYQEKILEGMGRMSCEPSVRGLMIQQGCLTACLQLDKGDKPNESEKSILRQARSCVAKLLVTMNPAVLTVSQRSGAVGPLLKLVKDSDALDLQHFEALLSLTNLAGFDNETKNRVVAQRGIPILSYAMFSEHEMVRQAGTEALCNMVPHKEMMEYLCKPDNLRVWMTFSLDYEEHFVCARAAIGCLAMACPDPELANVLISMENFNEFIRTLMECGQLELMHRVLALICGLAELGGKCKEAAIATGAGPFCEAYVASYQNENKTMEDFNFTPAERGGLAATLSLAKEVSKLLR